MSADDDLYSGFARRLASDEEARAAMPPVSLEDPVAVGMMFVNGLEAAEELRDALEFLVTPESREAWGDFSEAQAGLRSIENVGYSNIAEAAVGDPDVRYFKIHRGVVQNFESLDDQVVALAAVLTLVWRPEYGRWMVHQLGDYARPEDVPR